MSEKIKRALAVAFNLRDEIARVRELPSTPTTTETIEAAEASMSDGDLPAMSRLFERLKAIQALPTRARKPKDDVET